MKNCVICNGKTGLFSKNINIRDGILCSKCMDFLFEIGAQDVIDASQNINHQKLQLIIQEKKKLHAKFCAEFSVGDLLHIDYSHKIIKFNNVLLEFSNLAHVETEEHWEQSVETTSTSKKKGGLTRGLLGGILFGGVGAIIGAATAKNKTKTSSMETSYCSSVSFNLELRDYYLPYIILELDPTDKELRKAHCTNVQNYASSIKKLIEDIIKKA